MIIVVASYIIFGYFITTQLLEYYDYPTVIDMSVEYTDQVAFPAVTVCNQNMYK